jgi:hypothetical protein
MDLPPFLAAHSRRKQSAMERVDYAIAFSSVNWSNALDLANLVPF